MAGDDSFLRLGGDSITAIQLVTIAREAGISFTVKDIFDDPQLSAVAFKAIEAGDTKQREIEPFSMLPKHNFGAIMSSIYNTCELSSERDIQDAYTCTSLQEGLMALAVKQPGSYIAKYIYRLPTAVDSARFEVSWARTVELCGNLRTRIILHEGTTIQALIKEEPMWEATEGCNLRSVMNTAKAIKMHYGSRLCRYGLVHGEDSERYFILIIHHAIFDGWSLNVLLGTLYHSYRQIDIPPLQPYSGFIDYIVNLDQVEAGEYWKVQLDGAQRAPFPPRDFQIRSNPGEPYLEDTNPIPTINQHFNHQGNHSSCGLGRGTGTVLRHR